VLTNTCAVHSVPAMPVHCGKTESPLRFLLHYVTIFFYLPSIPHLHWLHLSNLKWSICH
jgi:hypothetical protein